MYPQQYKVSVVARYANGWPGLEQRESPNGHAAGSLRGSPVHPESVSELDLTGNNLMAHFRGSYFADRGNARQTPDTFGRPARRGLRPGVRNHFGFREPVTPVECPVENPTGRCQADEGLGPVLPIWLVRPRFFWRQAETRAGQAWHGLAKCPARVRSGPDV